MGSPKKDEKAPNALQKVWAKMQKNKWTCQTCGVLVDDNKKICPACEAPSPGPGHRMVSKTSSIGGLFSETTSSEVSKKPPIFNWALTPTTTCVNESSKPTFKTNLFSQTKSSDAGTPAVSTPVFNTSIFNKPSENNTESAVKKETVTATPPIPLFKFNTIGIHSPASQLGQLNAKSQDVLLKVLDPHRDLPIGSDIVMSCGYGGFAQLGLGEEEDEAPEGDDAVMGTPSNQKQKLNVTWPAPKVVEAQIPLRMPNLDDLNIASVVMGVMHGAVVTTDGRIFIWGGNDHSNLGFKGEDAWVPTEITEHFPEGTKIRKVTCGSSHTVFLTTKGEIFIAGTFKNDGWEGAYCSNTLSKKVDRLNKPTRLDVEQKKLGEMIDIASGLDHMLMLDIDGNIWEMGVTCLGQRTSKRNQHYYLKPRRVGMKNKGVRFKAVRCGSHYNLAISKDGDLYTWGQNNYLQCGHPLRPRQSNPELIDLPHKVNFNDPSVKLLDVGAGTHTTIALDTSGRLWSFGRNGSFELGRETEVPPKQMINGELQQFKNEPKADLPKQVIAIKEQVTQISVGANHWFAVTSDSTTYAVGVNLEFRTGVAQDEGCSRFVKVFHSGNLRQDFKVVDVAAGSNSSVFLLKRVQRSVSKSKRELNKSPIRRVKRKIEVMKK